MNPIKLYPLALLLSIPSSISYAAQATHPKECTVCTEEVEKGQLKLSCQAGHEIHGECLADYLSSMTHELTPEKAKEIKEKGIDCTGRESNNVRCQKKRPFSEVENCIGKMDEFKKFKTKLDEASASHCAASSGAGSSADDPHTAAVRRFKDKIESSFNLCCPGNRAGGGKCGGILAPIEGCNAATCESCSTTFCYLCLEQQGGSGAAHSHVRDIHSGNYWEWRDGHTGKNLNPGEHYTEFEEYDVSEPDPNNPGQRRIRREQVPYTYKDRYHWLLIRKKLEGLFHDEKDEKVKAEVLSELEPLLKKNKLWPLPFALNHAPDKWIEAVMKDPHIDQRNKIALLQNESIYQNQLTKKASSTPEVKAHAAKTMEQIKAKLTELKAPVLASLDVRDGAHAAAPAHANVTPLLENHEDENVRLAFVHLRDHAPRFFEMGGANGNLYRITDPEADPARRVPPFILSDAAHQKMNHADATAFCAARGATLPTLEQLEALARAMGRGQPGGYNRDLIPGVQGTYLWSSSVHPGFPYEAFSLNGYYGNVDRDPSDYKYGVRCAVGEPRG